MAQNRLQIEIDATWKGAGATSKAEKDITKLDKSAKTSGESFKGLTAGLGSAVVAIGGISGAYLAGKVAFDFLADGAGIQKTAETFEALSESIGSTADVLLNEMQRATSGTVTDLELMQSANKFVSMGLAESAEEAGKLAEIAVTLGTAMGDDAGASMENFALLLANQSIPRLDSFGISSGKVRERIAELTTGVNAMDRETAFMTATMEEAEKTVGKLGDTSDTTTNTFAQMETDVTNAINEIKRSFAEELAPEIGKMSDDVLPALTESVEELVPPMIDLLEVSLQIIAPLAKVAGVVLPLLARFNPLSLALDGVNDGFEMLDESLTLVSSNTEQYVNRLGALSEREQLLEQSTRVASLAVVELDTVMTETTPTAESLAEGLTRVGSSADSLVAQALKAGTSTSDFDTLLFDAGVQAGLTTNQILGLAGATGEYTTAQLDNALKTELARAKIAELVAGIQAGEMSVQQATTALADFRSELDAIPASKNIDIIANFPSVPSFFLDQQQRRQGGGVAEFAHGGAFSAGRPMLVGERGPELLMPSTSGTIVPNNQITNMSPTINITVAGGMGGSPQAIAQTVARELGEMIRR